MQVDFIFSIIVLIMSIVIHEVSHGYVANILGDPTARFAGRLTLNPVKHLDFFGSFLVPLLTYMAGGFIFGWAKPVPYNPYNLRAGRWGPAMVAVAGPSSNLLVAFVFGILIRFGGAFLSVAFIEVAVLIVFINVILAVFNLVPIPPLDGSKILSAVLPYRYHNFMESFERYGFMVLLIFIFFFFQLLMPIIALLFSLFTGLGF